VAVDDAQGGADGEVRGAGRPLGAGGAGGRGLWVFEVLLDPGTPPEGADGDALVAAVDRGPEHPADRVAGPTSTRRPGQRWSAAAGSGWDTATALTVANWITRAVAAAGVRTEDSGGNRNGKEGGDDGRLGRLNAAVVRGAATGPNNTDVTVACRVGPVGNYLAALGVASAGLRRPTVTTC
jgi:hypothetical protein